MTEPTEINKNNSILTPNIRKYKSLGMRHTRKTKNNGFKTPLSESKVNVIFVTKTDSPKTPLTDFNLETCPHEDSKSTGCLPVYKLSMSKRFRAHYKKKKLLFSTADDVGTCSTESIQSSGFKDLQIEKISENNRNPQHLSDNIFQQQHENKITELKNTIEIWKIAFKNSLDDLSNKLNEDKESILQRLQILPDMIKLA